MGLTTIVLMFLTVISKFFGFVRDIVLSYFYGASMISDAYLISRTIPFTIFAFIGVAISTSFIPLYSTIENESSTENANKFTSKLINYIVVICIVIAILIFIFAKPVVKIFALGFDGDSLNLAVQFTKISIFGIILSGVIYVLKGYLEQKQMFYLTGIMSLPQNIVIIIAIVMSSTLGYLILPIGGVVALVAQMIFLLIPSYKTGYRHRLFVKANNDKLKSMLLLSLPIIIGVSVNEINVIVDRTIASLIATGGITALTYANRLNVFIQGVFGMSVATVMYPIITRKAVEGDVLSLKRILSTSITRVNLLVVPSIVFTMFYAENVVNFLFGRGEFDNKALIMTSGALFFYSIGMIGFGLREVLSRVFYALQDTKTPTINAVIGMLVNVVLNIILSKFYGLKGLALATSIAAIITSILLFLSLQKKIGSLNYKSIFSTFLKVLVASVLSGTISKVFFNYLSVSINENISLCIVVFIGIIIYFTTLHLLKVNELKTIVQVIKNKLSRKK